MNGTELKYGWLTKAFPESRESKALAFSDGYLLEVRKELMASRLLVDDVWLPVLDGELFDRDRVRSA